MKLDEHTADQKLSLDVTPLIDVVFLLVLFFAVSTSFISAEDLQGLKSSLVTLTVDKQQLSGRLAYQDEEIDRLGGAFSDLQTEYDRMVEQKTAELRQLGREIERKEGEAAKYQWMLDALEKEKVTLLEQQRRGSATAKALKEQLEQAFKDYASLTLKLDTLKVERDDQARTEALLLALYEERSAEASSVEEALERSESARANLAETVAARTKESTNLTLELEVLRRRVARQDRELEKHEALALRNQNQADRITAARATIGQALAAYLKDQSIGIEQTPQKLVLQLADRILFDSGSAEIKPEGLTVLRSVGKILLARLGDLSVRIGGHTDNVPMRVIRTDGLDSNWSLSSARAVNVVRFLENEVGISPEKLAATGYGEHQPIADNRTAAGRARNRRIEIVLVPPSN